MSSARLMFPDTDDLSVSHVNKHFERFSSVYSDCDVVPRSTNSTDPDEKRRLVRITIVSCKRRVHSKFSTGPDTLLHQNVESWYQTMFRWNLPEVAARLLPYVLEPPRTPGRPITGTIDK
jgi:hypothetical protein